MPQRALFVKEWEREMVYLVQFPRPGYCPSMSPFCLKMETWLRMAKLPYKNVSNNFKRFSAKGQVPFVELNGREIADSNHIVRELAKHFHVELDAKLSPRELAHQRAYHALIEDSLRWAEWYFRCTDRAYSDFLCSDEQGIGYALTPCQKTVTKYVMVPWMQRDYFKRCMAVGIGRDSAEEVEELAKANLRAVSQFIGPKRYIMGDRLTSLDATAFGHLIHFHDRPGMERFRAFLDAECKCLAEYLMRMKREFWPDWELVTKGHSMDSYTVDTGVVTNKGKDVAA